MGYDRQGCVSYQDTPSKQAPVAAGGAFFPIRLRCSPALMRQAKAATTSRTALDAPNILHQARVTVTHSRSVSRRYKCRLRTH